MLEVLKQYLDKFHVQADQDYELIMRVAEVRNYNRKVIVVHEGETEQYFNFIARGLARKYFLKGKEEIITQIAREGEMISSSVSFFTGDPSTYFVETIEPTVFVSFTRDTLEDLYQTDRKWQRLGRLIITELLLQKEYWELDRIQLNTHDRVRKFLTTNSDLLQRVPQKYFASYLNIKPETFSRLKHLLKN